MNIYKTYKKEISKHYRILDVTEAGFDFVLQSLRFGRTLSNLVARNLPIESGKIETFIHRSIKKDKSFQFKRGYISQKLPESLSNFPGDGSKRTVWPEMDFFVIPTILEFLAEDEKNICVIEDIDSSPGNLQSTIVESLSVFTFQDIDVYFYIDKTNPTIAFIRKTFSTASPPWSTMAFLTNTPITIKPNQQLELKSLETIAKNTKKIIIGAYDGESYLIWHNPQNDLENCRDVNKFE
jgi:hypothetical protein